MRWNTGQEEQCCVSGRFRTPMSNWYSLGFFAGLLPLHAPLLLLTPKIQKGDPRGYIYSPLHCTSTPLPSHQALQACSVSAAASAQGTLTELVTWWAASSFSMFSFFGLVWSSYALVFFFLSYFNIISRTYLHARILSNTQFWIYLLLENSQNFPSILYVCQHPRMHLELPQSLYIQHLT